MIEIDFMTALFLGINALVITGVGYLLHLLVKRLRKGAK